MTEDERRTWIRERGIPGYTLDIARAGLLSERAARRKAEADYAGLDTAEGVDWRHAVADVDGMSSVVGGVAWRIESGHGEPTLHVDDVEIYGQFRGRGLGRALMETVLTEARARGMHRVSLTVWEGNDVARALYLALGFTPVNTSMSLDLWGLPPGGVAGGP